MREIIRGGRLERVMGIEPTYAAWEAAVLPLNYTRGSTAISTSRGWSQSGGRMKGGLGRKGAALFEYYHPES